MKIAIQINNCLSLGKTTESIIRECVLRQHDVHVYSINDLHIANGLVFTELSKVYLKNNRILLGNKIKYNLDDYDIALMRNDPPFDIGYITATYLLEMCNTPVINNPCAVRNFPEKILFYDKYTFPTLISRNLSSIREFCSEYSPFIIKPLYEFGGKNILKFEKYDESVECVILLMLEKYDTPIIIQKFSDKVLSDGDKRVVILDGEILGFFGRQNKESFKVNMCLGGNVLPTKLTTKEKVMCNNIADDLKSKGIYIAGIDLIDERVTEINVTSIAGIAELDYYFKINASTKLVTFLEYYIH